MTWIYPIEFVFRIIIFELMKHINELFKVYTIIKFQFLKENFKLRKYII
jgi:hypothetical protein